MSEDKQTLLRYLHTARDALVWKLDGLSDYDVRRPMTPTGTSLLGLVKHVGATTYGYLGEAFDRAPAEPIPWGPDDDPNLDLYATAEETREGILAFHTRAWEHADATVATLDLDSVGAVPWWPAERRRVTLQAAMVHLLAEVSRHAGHADIVRESIDGTAGLRAEHSNLVSGAEGYPAYVERLEQIARTAR